MGQVIKYWDNCPKGTVPHPKGNIWVDWKIIGNVLYLNYKVPEGVKVTVKPKGRLASYKLVLNS
jgi:hypothetical protein